MSARPPVTNLDDIKDVIITTPVDNQGLIYNASTSKWNNDPIPSGTLATLTDTSIATPVDKQVLKYDTASSRWINYGPLGFSDITGNINVTQVNNGTDADATTYYRGDGVWAAPAQAGTIPATTSVLIGDNAGNAAIPSPAWAAGTTGLSATGTNNGDFGLDLTNTAAGAVSTSGMLVHNGNGVAKCILLGPSYTPAGIYGPDDYVVTNQISAGDTILATNAGVIKFSNNNLTNERARIGNGLSVGTTTDPGIGIVNALTGYQINGTATAATYRLANVSIISPAAVDVYLAASKIIVPVGGFKALGIYRCVFDIVKTAAGVATPIITLRIGTAGTTADTAQITFTFGNGTAVVDTGTFEVFVNWRSVGSGTSAVVSGFCRGTHNLAITGLFNNAAVWTVVGAVSGGFDSSAATTMGLSFNGGTAFAGTITTIQTTLTQ